MPEEYYFNSVDEAMKVWPLFSWAAKGKPKLWVRVFDQGEDIKVWRDYGYGGLKLKTLSGENEGKGDLTVGSIVVTKKKMELSRSFGTENSYTLLTGQEMILSHNSY